MERLVEYVSQRSVFSGKIGMVGFCWGGWVVFQTSAMSDKITCGISPHPSVHIEEALFGRDSAALGAAVQCPMHLMPAGNDPDSYHASGAIFGAVAANHPGSASTVFPDMKHGWMPRMDITDEAVKRDVDKGMGMIFEWLERFLV
jgi:dienelactone hydrolase